jgi:RNA polymerase sigma factor (sigma-70 family)
MQSWITLVVVMFVAVLGNPAWAGGPSLKPIDPACEDLLDADAVAANDSPALILLEGRHENPPEMVKELVTRNMKLAYYQANRYRWLAAAKGYELADAEGAALEGLFRAALTWNPERGAFASFARRVISNWTRRQVGENGGLENAKKRRGYTMRMSDAVMNDSDLTFEDILSEDRIDPNREPDANSPEKIALDRIEVQEQLRPILDFADTLNERERAIFLGRIVLPEEDQTPLLDFGKRFGVTRERIRQLEARIKRRYARYRHEHK